MKSIFLTTMLIAAALSNKEAQAPLIAPHLIAPDDIGNSLEEYHHRRQALALNFKNHSHPIHLIDITHTALIVSYENGIVVMGFNHAKGQPTSQLSVYEGQFDSRVFDSKKFEMSSLDSAENIYTSTDVSIAQDKYNQIYIGKLKEQNGAESFTARVVFNKTLMTHHSNIE
ncbi:hypothetical protein Ssed_4410 [Shewanella sediminis HAW-EB3]|uniref:Uncharacterized protein n=1 Tax=Shewanella sediminis (strain HAW-EB3) TaxID=425104 RepID=A8G1N9_SHESH|nr:hypothetical protein [Shewanella sediminis]ABV39012.1 hypothetical protein Ssed_4410 [Shewanella sediminis HAW-EB3]